MTSINNRTEIEKRLITSAQKIKYIPDECFDELNLREFFDTWHELTQYYGDKADTVISVEVVREYLDNLDYFYAIWKKPDVNRECQEQSEEALRELESYMRDIIGYVEAGVSPDTPPN